MLLGCGGSAGLREIAPQVVGLTLIRTIESRSLPVPIREPFSLIYSQYLYVSDRLSGDFYWCDSTGKRLGGGGISGIGMRGGGYLSSSRSGDFLLCEPTTRKILRFDQRAAYRGMVSQLQGTERIEISGPISAIEAIDGTIWVVDIVDERLESISPFSTFADSTATDTYRRSHLSYPSKLIRTRSYDMVLAHTGGNELVLYDDRGEERNRVPMPAGLHPTAVTEGRGGQYWVLDTKNARVILVSSRGELKYMAGPLLDGASQVLQEPTDIHFRFGSSPADDQLVIADAQAGMIYFLRPISVAP